MILSRKRATLVIVGTGMAAGKLVEEVLVRAPDRFHIRMFGAEPHGTYNRILLSRVLGGAEEDAKRLWLNPLEWYEQHGVVVHAGVKAEAIDRGERVVVGGGGKVAEPYDFLVLATGSRPWLPPLPGVGLGGVFTFRTLEDCAAIAAYAQQAERAVVLGGGLLGLEAARGLLHHGLEVTVVEMGPHLMPQQLDDAAGSLLQRKLESMGLRVLVRTTVAQLLGEDGRVCGVQLADGTTLPADMVVVSCGIRPNVELAAAAGLTVERGIVVDDQLRTSDAAIYGLGECIQHRGKLYGLVDPVYDQARVLADVLTGHNPQATYAGSALATTLKVMGIDLTVMGEVSPRGTGPQGWTEEVVSHLDPDRGMYQKIVLRERRLVGAIVLGIPEGGRLLRLFKSGQPIDRPAHELLLPDPATASPDSAAAAAAELDRLPDDALICNCNQVSKGRIVAAIRQGKCTIEAVGESTRAGTGCGSCQLLIGQLLERHAPTRPAAAPNKIELIKQEKDGLDALPDILRLAEGNRWQEMTEADKQRAKWHGLFFRMPTPGHFMMRLRLEAGQANSRQFRTIAELCDAYGKGFCDLTTRQQIQLRWFTLADVPEIWRRLQEVGLHSKQTGMDNVRGVCGCPLAGLTPNELLDATPAVRAFTAMIVDNKEFTNLPRKFNVTITGCLENCCHAETQDLALVPATRTAAGQTVAGFNVLVGGKQGSGGYVPARPLDVFVPPEDAAGVCAELTRIFRDHGPRGSRTRARLAFLVEDRGVRWLRDELQRRWGRPLLPAGEDARKSKHTDHLGIQPQKGRAANGSPLYSVGLLVPVGRITSAQLRAVADLADRYGSGDIRLTVGQNLVIPNVPEDRLAELTSEPICRELPYDPSPILRGLVACTGNDYCHMALIDTKGYAIQIAQELERRTQGRTVRPLTIHWSGCPAGCGLHHVASIGLQGCRTRIQGQVVDAVHVSVNGRAGPEPRLATDLMYDVPIERLADALEPLVLHLPREG